MGNSAGTWVTVYTSTADTPRRSAVPWNTQSPAAEQRADFVALLHGEDCSFSEACRRFGISRKTGYKWHSRASQPEPQPLRDRSRRPHTSPGRTPPDQEQEILNIRDAHRWGARKIHARLSGM